MYLCYFEAMNLHEKIRCSKCESRAARRSFLHFPGAVPHYAPDLSVKLEKLILDVTIDPEKKTAEAVLTQRAKKMAAGLKQLRLDQIGIQVNEVSVEGAKAAFYLEGGHLFIELPDAVKKMATGSSFEFVVKYSVQNPRRGLYFTGPDADYPKKPFQVWSQGQDEDNRHWIPTLDYPNQKVLIEILAKVPKGYTAVANGGLVSKKDEGAFTQFHYKLGMPLTTYLISLVVAKFSEWSDKGPRGLPVQYFVAPGREEDAKRAFGNTPKMIEAFEKATGVHYPYEKYSQVAVQDFIFGGMENTSATTQTDRCLLDERAKLDNSSDPLVSHELAHQWFGDLLTCRDWSHGWLNEGFATFMERVWVESNVGEYGSKEAAWEEAKYYSYLDLLEYLQEDSSAYRRPIVCNTYVEPIDLFDRHLYQKGGLVLNLIRAELGDEMFWKSVNTYLERHRGQSVETLDLIRAIEDTTGRNLRRFFDQWVFGAGHPVFEVAYKWDEEKKLVELAVEQKQTDGKSQLVKDDVITRLFHLDVKIEITQKDGKKAVFSLPIKEAKDRLFIPCETKPAMVRFDPENTIPKTLSFPRPKELLIYQLQKDSDCMGRIEAAKELGKIADAEILTALGQAVAHDSFWGVQAEVADVLKDLRTPTARDHLIQALGTSNPKARRAIARALGAFKDSKASEALKKFASKDPSYLVEAEATAAYAVSAAEREPEAVEKFLIDQLSKGSHLDVIRGAALRSFAELPGVGQGQRVGAWKGLTEWLAAGKPEDTRAAAIDAFGKIARTANPTERAKIRKLLDGVADEDRFRVRVRLIAALQGSEDVDSIPILQKIRLLDSDGRVRRDAYVAIDALMTSRTMPESVQVLKMALEKLEEEHRKLKASLEELKGQSGAAR